MDSEADLLETVHRSRAELVARADELIACLKETLDPLRPVRRNPLGGIVASMAAGVLLGARPAAPSARAEPTPRDGAPPSKFAALLWRSLPLLGPFLQEVAVRWTRDRGTRRDGASDAGH